MDVGRVAVVALAVVFAALLVYLHHRFEKWLMHFKYNWIFFLVGAVLVAVMLYITAKERGVEISWEAIGAFLSGVWNSFLGVWPDLVSAIWKGILVAAAGAVVMGVVVAIYVILTLLVPGFARKWYKLAHLILGLAHPLFVAIALVVGVWGGIYDIRGLNFADGWGEYLHLAVFYLVLCTVVASVGLLLAVGIWEVVLKGIVKVETYFSDPLA